MASYQFLIIEPFYQFLIIEPFFSIFGKQNDLFHSVFSKQNGAIFT